MVLFCFQNPRAAEDVRTRLASSNVQKDFLESGQTCSPTCDAGYTRSGDTTCTAGVLTLATCDADACSLGDLPLLPIALDCDFEVDNEARVT